MQVYLINLNRRTDRLERSAEQFRRCGIQFKRVNAVDASEVCSQKPGDRRNCHPHFPLTDGETSCLLSHLKVWKEFLSSGNKYCVVLEDDLVLSPYLPFFFDAFGVSGIQAGVVRLETYLQSISLNRIRTARVSGITLHKFYSEHWGAAAYILGRRFAEKLMGLVEDLLMPVDHLLFDPLCPLFHKARILQAVPALCVQGNRLHAGRLESVYESDLEAERAIARAGLQYQAAIKLKPRTVSGKTVREVKRALMKIDNLLGLSKLRHDPIPATIPFLDHLLDERHIRARASFNLFAHFA